MAGLPKLRRGRRTYVGGVAMALSLLLAGCGAGSDTEPGGAEGSSEQGEAAVWRLQDEAAVSEESTTLDIEVTRLACASGVTGELLPAQVSESDTEVVIRVDAVPRDEGAADCQGNDWVAVVVELDEPVGERALIDGACLEGEAVDTAFCDSAVRWG